MKKTVKVVIEKEFEIDIPDFQLTPEHIAMFESGIFSLDENGDSHEDKVNEYFKYAARCAAYGHSQSDGLGDIGHKYEKKHAKDLDYFVLVEELYDEAETEIM